MSDKQETQVREVLTLNAEMIRKLESKLPKPICDNATSAHDAGFRLGCAYVVRMLRDGFN